MFKILKRVFNALGYSHSGNKKVIQSNLDNYISLLKYNYDILLKIVSDFRTAHMNIIAGMIAFLGLVNKDGIQNDIHFKYGVVSLLIFIAISIISILFSFYYDTFFIRSTMKNLGEYVKMTKYYKDEILKFDFDKNKAEEMNKKLLAFKSPTFPIFSIILGVLYSTTWLVLIFGLYNIIMYYIGMI